jgi:hypothetical protein
VKSGRFQKGKSGNPGGRPRVLGEVQELARQHGPEAIKMLTSIMEDENAPPSARVSAAGMILDRGYGKPPQFTTGDEGRFKKATEMSDAELDEAITRIEAQLRGIEGEPAPSELSDDELAAIVTGGGSIDRRRH